MLPCTWGKGHRNQWTHQCQYLTSFISLNPPFAFKILNFAPASTLTRYKCVSFKHKPTHQNQGLDRCSKSGRVWFTHLAYMHTCICEKHWHRKPLCALVFRALTQPVSASLWTHRTPPSAEFLFGNPPTAHPLVPCMLWKGIYPALAEERPNKAEKTVVYKGKREGRPPQVCQNRAYGQGLPAGTQQQECKDTGVHVLTVSLEWEQSTGLVDGPQQAVPTPRGSTAELH